MKLAQEYQTGEWIHIAQKQARLIALCRGALVPDAERLAIKMALLTNLCPPEYCRYPGPRHKAIRRGFARCISHLCAPPDTLAPV